MKQLIIIFVLIFISASLEQNVEDTTTVPTSKVPTDGTIIEIDLHPDPIKPPPRKEDKYPLRPIPMDFANRVFQLLTRLFRPIRVSGKTYGQPNVIAIIGDKPYISLELFNKFSPFRWLVNIFRGKVQDLCDNLEPNESNDPQEIVNQLMQQNPQIITN